MSTPARESDGLVRSPLESPMLQPWEVWDQSLFDLEMMRVFARSWIWLGDTEDLQREGDFITGRIGYQSVLVIRQADGSIKGFLNNCRHRASALTAEPAGNCGHTLTCPYHNWSYRNDGTLIVCQHDILAQIPSVPAVPHGVDVPYETSGCWCCGLVEPNADRVGSALGRTSRAVATTQRATTRGFPIWLGT